MRKKEGGGGAYIYWGESGNRAYMFLNLLLLPKHLQDLLIKAKLSKNKTLRKSGWKITGMKNCNKSCNMCPFVLQTKEVQ